MKGVLGLLFLFSGFVMAYLVLSGKLPNPNSTVITPPPPVTLPPPQSLSQTKNALINKNGGGAGGPMGIQLGPNGNDVTGTRGGFY